MLTRRQLEVLQYVAEGYTADEIGDMIGRSRETVERHRMEIMRRLGAKNAANAVTLAIMRGLLELPRAHLSA